MARLQSGLCRVSHRLILIALAIVLIRGEARLRDRCEHWPSIGIGHVLTVRCILQLLVQVELSSTAYRI